MKKVNPAKKRQTIGLEKSPANLAGRLKAHERKMAPNKNPALKGTGHDRTNENTVDLLSKPALERAGQFLLSITVLFIAFSFLFSLIGIGNFEAFYAHGTLAILSPLGFSGEVIEKDPVLLSLGQFKVQLGFSYLCTGLLELALVWAAVLSTAGISIGKRLLGAVSGAAVLVFFNFFRIVSSIIIIQEFGFEAGNFSHDLMFRAFLLATIAGFYYFWLGWATRDTKQ